MAATLQRVLSKLPFYRLLRRAINKIKKCLLNERDAAPYYNYYYYYYYYHQQRQPMNTGIQMINEL